MSVDFSEELENYGNKHGEPHWLVQRRLDALNKIADAPEMEVDHFKNNQIKPYSSVAPEKIKLTKEVLKQVEIDDEEIGMIQIGQSSLENTLDEDDEDNGVILTDIFTAFRQHPRLIQSYFMNKVVPEDTNKITQTLTAFFNNGMFLYLPKNYHLTDTVILRMIQDNIHDQPLVTHLFIYAEEGSSVKIVHDLSSVGVQTSFINCGVEILARPGSSIDLTTIDHASQDSTVYFNRGAKVSRDAKLNWQLIECNAGDTLGNLQVKLANKSAMAKIKTITLQRDHNYLGINTALLAKASELNDEIEQFGTAEQSSQLVLNAGIFEKTADFSNNFLTPVQNDSDYYTYESTVNPIHKKWQPNATGAVEDFLQNVKKQTNDEVFQRVQQALKDLEISQ